MEITVIIIAFVYCNYYLLVMFMQRYSWYNYLLEICHKKLFIFFYILYYRYGIRVDPRQWFSFLSDGGEEYPSLLLICCK